MEHSPAQPDERDLEHGDHIQIQQGRRSIPELIGHSATIVELFRVPRGSCMARIDGDADQGRLWFLYRDEFVVSDAV